MNRPESPLGLWTLVALVVANMIGAGVFTTSGFALADLGSPLLVLAAWIIGGGIALCGALSYGALARLIPASGGEYLYLSRAIHPLAGFLAGWVSLLAGFTAAIAYSAITFIAYVAPSLSGTARGNATASALILAAALLHGIRLRPGARVQNAIVGVKLALIGAFCVFAIYTAITTDWAGLNAPAAVSTEGFPLGAFALTLMWISFSYAGFNAATYIAGEVPDAQRAVPKALVLGTLITIVVYLALNSVFVLAPEHADVAGREDIAAIAARAIGGGSLDVIVRIIIALALLTSVSAMIMIGPRVYAKMADDGLLPKALRFDRDIPVVAIWMQAALATVVVWITGLRELLSYLGFTLSLSTAATVASLFIVARRSARDVELPGYPWAPAIFVAATLGFAALAAEQSPIEMLAAGATVVSGILLYFVIARGRRAAAESHD
jgi:APA family basic amino acid/polyamine antiporter